MAPCLDLWLGPATPLWLRRPDGSHVRAQRPAQLAHLCEVTDSALVSRISFTKEHFVVTASLHVAHLMAPDPSRR